MGREAYESRDLSPDCRKLGPAGKEWRQTAYLGSGQAGMPA